MIDKFKKQNALINAIFDSEIKYKEVHHDLSNLIMGVIQKIYRENKDFNTIVLSKEQICKYANLDLSSNIFPHLKDLIKINYTFTTDDIKKLKKTGLNITNRVSAFITDIVEENSEDKRSKIYKIKFNTDLFSFLLDNKFSVNHGNYAVIKIADIAFLNSKYQKMLGELFLEHKYKKEFSFHYDFLRKKFNIENKAMGYLMDILKLHLPKLQDKFMHFKYEFHKKDKLLSISLK